MSHGNGSRSDVVLDRGSGEERSERCEEFRTSKEDGWDWTSCDMMMYCMETEVVRKQIDDDPVTIITGA